MSRIGLTDSVADVIAKMADGNPGACTAMIEMIKHGKEIDPLCFMGGLGAVMLLDTFGIYGTDIYILYSDQCKRDVRELLMLLRAGQFGFVREDKIKAVAADQMDEVRFSKEEMDEFNEKVCKKLETFMPRKVV